MVSLAVPLSSQPGKDTCPSQSTQQKAPSFYILLFPTIVLLLRAVVESYSSWLTVLLALGSERLSAVPALSTHGSSLPASFLNRRISCLYLQWGSSTIIACVVTIPSNPWKCTLCLVFAVC